MVLYFFLICYDMLIQLSAVHVVKWISYMASDHALRVRVLPWAQGRVYPAVVKAVIRLHPTFGGGAA